MAEGDDGQMEPHFRVPVALCSVFDLADCTTFECSCVFGLLLLGEDASPFLSVLDR